MSTGAWSLVGSERMRALDRYTIDALGVPGEVLMESAGRAVLEVVLDRWRSGRRDPGAEVLVVCGAGNNGGDGLVVARHLAQLDVPVRVALLTEPERLRGDAAANLARAQAVGVRIEGADAPPPGRGCVVDAIFGTGLAREVTGVGAEWIERIVGARSEGRVEVVAVDLPSGVDADTGQVHGCAIEADRTVTIASPKIGLTLEPGRSLAGEVGVARIGIADRLPDEIEAEGFGAAQLWTDVTVAAQLPDRLGRRGDSGRRSGPGTAPIAGHISGHKGSFGHVLVVAASEGKTGAAALTATAAIRSGAGLVTIACPRSLNDVLEVKCTEAMTVAVDETPGRGLAESALEAIVGLADARDVVALGPGIGQDAATQSLVHGLAAKIGTPLVVDADGLNAFVRDPAALAARPAATVLTPHPGEAARLLGTSASEVNRDRIGAARELSASTGAVVLLKGAATVCAEPGGSVVVNPTGGPNLASGGTGDVLTGIVAALIGQGLAPFAAAATAAWWHGRAGDELAVRHGGAGTMAHEVADALPAAARTIREEGRRGRGSDPGRTGTLLPFPGC